ncbi:MAG: hypothetical protein WDZ93_03865 [Candidatus Paceibacterota bacterium]
MKHSLFAVAVAGALTCSVASVGAEPVKYIGEYSTGEYASLEFIDFQPLKIEYCYEKPGNCWKYTAEGDAEDLTVELPDGNIIEAVKVIRGGKEVYILRFVHGENSERAGMIFAAHLRAP